MIRFTTGNILDADTEALVNTVNTVGVMGKGIALMFSEAFPENRRAYVEACKRGEVRTGRMFVTENPARLDGGPRWIVNFPTKQHWRGRSRMEWIAEGLEDLRRVIRERGIRSIAVPPLGCGAGGLGWSLVRAAIVDALGDFDQVDVVVYEPTPHYQNVTKRRGVQKLTPARAMVAELVRSYSVLGIECSVLEIQKMAWFLERSIESEGLSNPLGLDFSANRYGPYSDRLRHLLDALDGSYLHCERRLADARPADAIWFDDAKRDFVAAYLGSGDARPYQPALERTTALIDGFQSPLGLELLATVDWLIVREGVKPEPLEIRDALAYWPGGRDAGERKLRLFDDRMLGLALQRLATAA